MDETIGRTAGPTLTASPSLIDRHQPEAACSVSTSARAPYVTQLISPSEAALLSYSDDGFFRYHDKATLSAQSAVRWERGGDCTALISAGSGYMATGRKGVVGYWDARTDKDVASLGGPSRAPYLSLACNGSSIVAAGTELQGVDAAIDLWDIRSPAKPIISYMEAHSDDITSLAFHPQQSHVLLSSSSDSLAAVSDIRKTDEDDSVLGVINTGASVARLGWGGSSRTFEKAILEGEQDGAAGSDIPNLGAFWTVSDMQTLGVWEADGWGELLSPSDIRQADMMMTPSWQTEFVIDASAAKQMVKSADAIGVFCGNQDGSAALIEIPSENPSAGGPAWTMQCRLTGGHSEVVRSVHWDLNNSCVFTGAEDGLICGWQLNGASPPKQGPPTTSLPIQQHGSTGVIKEERSRPSYRPY